MLKDFFLKLAFFLSTFRYIFRIPVIPNKVFYFSHVNMYFACYLSQIDLQLERKAWFYMAQRF